MNYLRMFFILVAIHLCCVQSLKTMQIHPYEETDTNPPIIHIQAYPNRLLMMKNERDALYQDINSGTFSSHGDIFRTMITHLHFLNEQIANMQAEERQRDAIRESSRCFPRFFRSRQS